MNERSVYVLIEHENPDDSNIISVTRVLSVFADEQEAIDAEARLELEWYDTLSGNPDVPYDTIYEIEEVPFHE
jgi:hypothetical protein